MSHVVIVAGGLGSRLAPLTNHIPKFLVNIGKQTGYVEQVRYWQTQGELESLTVIVHSAYADLISAYHELYFPDSGGHIPLIVKTVDVANGSAHAILSTCQHLHGEDDVFFQWCDVMPAVPMPSVSMLYDSTVIFTNYDHPNRYGVSGPENNCIISLQPDSRGGIFGLYYVKRFKTDIKYEDGQDFVDVIHQYGKMQEHCLSAIVDWGDMPKLNRTRATADHAREFNSVEIHDGLVLKSALNPQGEVLIAREINWYNSLEHYGEDDYYVKKPNVPKIWAASDSKSFVMSKVQGVPVFELWPTLDAEARVMVLERMVVQLKTLHSMNKHSKFDNATLLRDIKKEAYDKLISRYTEIKDVISAFGHIDTVNGFKLRELNPLNTIQRLFATLVSNYPYETKYTKIHGDAQMSNTMINPDTLEVTLIDPRGYFGDTQLHGLADYDISKLLYSLSGYDLFNYATDFGVSINGSHLEFNIPKPDLGGCETLMNTVFWHKHYLWLAVIWIGLAAYIKNDPVKSLAAHYHGLAMAEQVLAGINDRFNP